MVFCFAGVVMVGAYSFFTAREALIQRTYQQLISLKEEKKSRIKSFFLERDRDVNHLASSENIHNLLKELGKNNRFEIQEFTSTNKQTFQYLVNARVFSSFSLCSNQSNIYSFKIGADGDLSAYYSSKLKNTSLFENYKKVIEQKSVAIFDLTRSSISDEYSLVIGSPIFNADSSVLGVLFLEIYDDAINSIMAERISEKGLGNTGEVYLVGHDNLLRSSSRFIEKSILAISYSSDIVTDAKQGISGVKKTEDYRNQEVLSAYGPVELANLDWVIVAEMDYKEALEPIHLLGVRILLLSFIVFIFLTIGVFILSKRITAPLVRLTESAKRVGDGQLEQTLPIINHDETGILTQVFNKMILQIKQTTSSLKEREQRLTHFYKATVDGILLHKSGTPVLVNHGLGNLTGYTEDELMKKSPHDYLIIEEDLYIEAKQNKIFSFEAILRTKWDKRIYVEVQKNSLFFHGQEVEALVIRDITKRKVVEEELQTERLRQMRSVIDGQEQERQRLSRELHDGLGQTLVAIKLKLESIPLDEVGNQRIKVESVKEMFNHTIEETRRMSNNLMPAALTEFSLAVVLRNLCMEIESNSGISVSLVIGVLPESFNQLIKTYIYRIAQEALNNIVKHSGASRAVISIFSDISKLYLHIEDNGVGFDPSKGYESGNGLYNMKERAVLLGGKFEIITSKGNGVKIQAEFPILQKQKV